MKINELKVPREFFGMTEHQFYQLIYSWYAGQNPRARDRLATIEWPAELKTVPNTIIYRGLMLREKSVLNLVNNGEPIKLSSKYLTSSWSISKTVAENAAAKSDIPDGYMAICVQKKVKPRNVVLYTPNLNKVPVVRKLIRDADSTLRDTLSGGGWEKEVIVRNDEYYLTITLKDLVTVEKFTVPAFKRQWAKYGGIYFPKY